MNSAGLGVTVGPSTRPRTWEDDSSSCECNELRDTRQGRTEGRGASESELGGGRRRRAREPGRQGVGVGGPVTEANPRGPGRGSERGHDTGGRTSGRRARRPWDAAGNVGEAGGLQACYQKTQLSHILCSLKSRPFGNGVQPNQLGLRHAQPRFYHPTMHGPVRFTGWWEEQTGCECRCTLNDKSTV